MKKIFIMLFFGFIIFIFFFNLHNKNIVEDSLLENDGDYVVLLHGLGRSSFSMQKIGRELADKGYKVLNIDYPSRQDNIENLVDKYLKKELAEKCTDKSKKINFVTHSMGGIMVRYLLLNNNIENIGRIVMLAPPNQGSNLADRLVNNKIIAYILGPALGELMIDKNSFTNKLGPINYEIGIIAGQYDNKVSVEEAKLDEMADFVVVPKIHTWIMNNGEVIDLLINFLDKGKFSVE